MSDWLTTWQALDPGMIVEYRRWLIGVIVDTLREDGWLGHTQELEEWHLNALASAIANKLMGG